MKLAPASAETRSKPIAVRPVAVLTIAPAHGTARQPIRFEVQARDGAGLACDGLAGAESRVRMRLRGPVVLSLDVTDCGDGRYEPWKAALA